MIILIAVAALACFAAAQAAAVTVPRPPNLPKMPKVTTYPATLDVAGYITVRQHRDSTQDCAQGRDMVIEYEAHAELGAPKRVKVMVVNGVTTSTPARRAGGAVHRAAITSYSETNWCPPTRPSPPIGQPACKPRIAGALRASLTLTPEPTTDLTPLVRGVSLALFRSGGGNQDFACLDFMQSLRPSVGPHALDVLELDGSGIVVPLGVTDVKVRTLKKGKALRRSITLNGACDHVLVRTGAAGAGTTNAIEESCTVKGRIYVQLKRTG